MQLAGRHMSLHKRNHLIWADKFALVLALSVAALGVVAGVAVLAAVGTLSDRRLDLAVVDWIAWVEIATALPVWLIMRGIDLIAGGPSHRLKVKSAPAAERHLQAG